MKRRDSDAINRRDFLRNGTAAVVAANYLGVHPTLVHTAPSDKTDALAIMKAANTAAAELSAYLQKLAEATANLKKQEAGLSKGECEKVVTIIDAVVVVVAASVLAAVSYGAGRPLLSVTTVAAPAVIADLDAQLRALSLWESALIRIGGMTAGARSATEKGRQIVANVKDVVVARDILFHLSQDKAHATALLEAARARNRAAVADMLRRDVPGSSVVVRDIKEEDGLLLSARINNFNYCLSTAGKCSGKPLTFAR